jgi:hypothetical protein
MTTRCQQTFLGDIEDLLPDTITVQSVTGRDVHNQLTFGTARTVACLVEGKTQIVRDVNGDDVTSAVTIYGTSGLSVYDKITLPSRFDPRSPRILTIERNVDELGNGFDVVYA